MLGKAIILIIIGMLVWAGASKLSAKLGLPSRQKMPPQPKVQKPLLTKFNLIIAGLILVYIVWGATQIF